MCYLLRTVSVFLLLALAGCATANAVERPGQVFVMRHLQAERGEDPGLTPAGRQDAQLLAGWFDKIDKPSTIFVTRYRRSQETVGPLAARLRINPLVYDPNDSAALVETVRIKGGNILVIGHSNTVPDIVERLGGMRPAPIQHHEHGDIWRVSTGSGVIEKLRLEEAPPWPKRRT